MARVKVLEGANVFDFFERIVECYFWLVPRGTYRRGSIFNFWAYAYNRGIEDRRWHSFPGS